MSKSPAGQFDKIDIATNQLDRVLSFFPRVDAKGSFLFAIDTAMLGVLASNFRKEDFGLLFHMFDAAVCVLLLAASLVFLYRASFPSLSGGQSSLIYFGAIGKLREAQFVRNFTSVSAKVWLEDLTSQIWRNSDILNAKYFSIKVSFILTALALIPWATFLVLVSITHNTVAIIK